MGDKVLVSVRARPLIKREKDAGDSSHWKYKGTVIQACHPGTKTLTGQPFNFDRIFDEGMSTSEVYKQVVSQIVEKSLQGYNGTVMCYGQTSSGKTHTLYGSSKEDGIISLTAKHLFDLIKNDDSRTYYIRVGLLEVYNEKVSDLLNNGAPVEIHEKNGVVAPSDLKEIEVVSAEEMLNAAKTVQSKRKIGETKLNKQSSRSHTILRIFIESVPNENEDDEDEEEQVQVTNALLNFVDLAGSEKANQTGAAGERFKEATFINKSLSVLSQVVLQLSGTANASNTSAPANSKGQLPGPQKSSNLQFVNYRDSKLTRLLQNSLNGNAYISLICNITPAALEETVSTLRFARNAKNIKVDPTKNQGPPTGAQYRIKILELENMLGGKASEVETLRRQIVSMQKFCQPVPCQQPSTSTGPSQPVRRKTVGPSVMTASRMKEAEGSPRGTDSENSEWLAEKKLLLFQLEKAELETQRAEIRAEKVENQLEKTETRLQKAQSRLEKAELENKVNQVDAANIVEEKRLLQSELREMKIKLFLAEKELRSIKSERIAEAHLELQSLTVPLERPNLTKEQERSPEGPRNNTGLEVKALMKTAEQSRNRCGNILQDLQDEIALLRLKTG